MQHVVCFGGNETEQWKNPGQWIQEKDKKGLQLPRSPLLLEGL